MNSFTPPVSLRIRNPFSKQLSNVSSFSSDRCVRVRLERVVRSPEVLTEFRSGFSRRCKFKSCQSREPQVILEIAHCFLGNHYAAIQTSENGGNYQFIYQCECCHAWSPISPPHTFAESTDVFGSIFVNNATSLGDTGNEQIRLSIRTP